MDDLIKKLVEEFKEEKKIEKATEEIDKANKIVAKVNKNGNVEVLGVSGRQTSLLATICLLLKEIEKYSDDSAEDMAMTILTALKMGKEIHD